MATFVTRIEDLTGTVETAYKSGSTDTDFVNDAIREAIYEIINLAPDNLIFNFTQTSSEITSNGQANPNMKIYAVQRESGVDGDFIECKELSVDYENKVQNPNSVFFATKQNPVYIRKDAKIFVYPAPSSSPDTFKYTFANYPTGDFASQSSINTFPDELEYVVVYGAAVRCAMHNMSIIENEIKDATDNAKKLFDVDLSEDDGASAESILHWLNDEDSEMSAATSQAAQTELDRMQALITQRESLQQLIGNLSGAYKSSLQSAGFISIPQTAQQGR